MTNAYFPFHALGFRANPFRALDYDEWAEIVVLPPETLRAAEAGGHLQVLGERGHGKTSTLLGMQAHLRRSGLVTRYEYLPDVQNNFRSRLDGVDVFLLDEAQRLSAPERGRLRNEALGGRRLILGSHEDLTGLFTDAGLALATVRPEASGHEHLESVLARRLAYFALTPDAPAVWFDDTAIAYLAAKFGGNLRAIHWFLYEFFQSLGSAGPISAEQLRVFPETY